MSAALLSEELSGSHGVRQKAPQMLDSITKVSPQNRSLLAQTVVAIATLLTQSKSSSVETLIVHPVQLVFEPRAKGSLADVETRLFRIQQIGFLVDLQFGNA